MKYILIILAMLVLIVPQSAYTQEVKTEDVTQVKEKQEFKSPDGGYSIEFPKEWRVEAGVMGLDVVALSPLDDEDDKFHENVNIIFSPLSEDVDRETYVQENMRGLEMLLTDFNLESDEDINVDGVPAKKLVYTHRMGELDLKVVQYLIMDDRNRAYVITFSAVPEDFNQHQTEFNEVVNSFKFNQ